MSPPLRILVVGATGFVGSNVVSEATKESAISLLVQTRSKDKLKNIMCGIHGMDEPSYDKIEVLVGDLLEDTAWYESLEGVDCLINAAGLVDVSGGNAALEEVNYLGVKRLYEQALAFGVKKIIHISSVTALYASDIARIDESSDLGKPVSNYARSKYKIERYVRSLVSSGKPIVTTYPAGIVGPFDPGHNNVNEAFLAFKQSGAMVLSSSGVQFIDVRDVARAHLMLAFSSLSSRYILAGSYMSWRVFAEKFETVIGSTLRKRYIPGYILRFIGRMADIFTRLFGTTAPFSYETMLFLTHWVEVDGGKFVDEFKFDLIPAEQTLADLFEWKQRSLASATHTSVPRPLDPAGIGGR